jgi:ferredoxin
MTKYGEYNPKKSLIRLLRNREFDVNVIALDMSCDYCGACVEWCPNKILEFVGFPDAAIIRKETENGKSPAPFVTSVEPKHKGDV